MTEEAVVLPKKTKKPPVEKPAAPEKILQHGIFRPNGPLTAKVWDVADAVTKEKGRPALRKEVWTRYKAEVPKAMESTSNTQYFKWVKFHDYSKAIREIRSGEVEQSETKQQEAAPAA